MSLRNTPKKRGPKYAFGDKEKMLFLDNLALYGNKSRACRLVGISVSTMRRHLKNDPEFAEAVEDCLEGVADELETAAYQRAVEGVKEDIIYNGQVVGERTVYSDSLLKTLLVAAKKEKYSPTSTINHQGSVEHKHVGIRDSILGKIDKLSTPPVIEDAEEVEDEVPVIELDSGTPLELDGNQLQSEEVPVEKDA